MMPKGRSPVYVPSLTALMSVLALAGCASLIDRRADTREAEWEAAYPPTGSFETVAGRRIHLTDTGGDGRAVVLVHGANGNLRDFSFDLIGRLSDHYRVIAVDRPGLGWSDGLGAADSDPSEQARLLRAALRQRGVRDPILVGHSYGGAVTMAWALEAPDDVSGVVLLGAATHPWDGALGTWYQINDTALGRPARALAAAFAPDARIAGVLESVFEPDAVPTGYTDHFGAELALRRDVQATNTRQVNALNTHVARMQPRYAGLDLPIEVLHGTADTIVGLEIHARRMVQEVATARLTELEGVGHMPHHARPDAVVEAVHRVAQASR